MRKSISLSTNKWMTFWIPFCWLKTYKQQKHPVSSKNKSLTFIKFAYSSANKLNYEATNPFIILKLEYKSRQYYRV